MATSQKNTGNGTDGGEFGPSEWQDVFNIVSSNNQYAIVDLAAASSYDISNTLKADQFGFDIPSTATIDGIVCTVERKAGAANQIVDYTVRILKNGSPVGTDKAATSTFWSTTEGDVSYGSPTDLWGTSWYSSDINNSSFGFQIRCEYVPAYSNGGAYVDLMYITVYYTLNNLKFGTTSVANIRYGNTSIKSIYYGSTRIS